MPILPRIVRAYCDTRSSNCDRSRVSASWIDMTRPPIRLRRRLGCGGSGGIVVACDVAPRDSSWWWQSLSMVSRRRVRRRRAAAAALLPFLEATTNDGGCDEDDATTAWTIGRSFSSAIIANANISPTMMNDAIVSTILIMSMARRRFPSVRR